MTIAIAIVVLVVAITFAVAAMKPDALFIQREARIKATPDTIYALVSDFHRWGSWAPQDKMDPTMKRTYSGASDGVGAVSEWDSRGRAGRGRMQITEASAPTRVTVRVDFIKPFEAHNVNEFKFEPEGDGTKVTWAMYGTNVYMIKVMSVLFKMDRMLGKHFEAGLRDLKSAAEMQTTAQQHPGH
jgi:carbon monoxide dehydrogenase subunit G